MLYKSTHTNHNMHQYPIHHIYAQEIHPGIPIFMAQEPAPVDMTIPVTMMALVAGFIHRKQIASTLGSVLKSVFCPRRLRNINPSKIQDMIMFSPSKHVGVEQVKEFAEIMPYNNSYTIKMPSNLEKPLNSLLVMIVKRWFDDHTWQSHKGTVITVERLFETSEDRKTEYIISVRSEDSFVCADLSSDIQSYIIDNCNNFLDFEYKSWANWTLPDIENFIKKLKIMKEFRNSEYVDMCYEFKCMIYTQVYQDQILEKQVPSSPTQLPSPRNSDTGSDTENSFEQVD